MSHIAAVQSAFPPHRHRQADLAALTADLCRLPAERRPLLDRLSAASGVGHRHTVLPTDAYHALSGPGALGAAAEHYLTRAADLGATAVRRALHAAGTEPAAVDLFVVTSVTGVAVPSLDAVLIPRLGLRTDLKRMPMFGLGCVGGAAGLARAHDYLQGWPGHTALVLAVELCSLSVPSTDPEVADLVVSTHGCGAGT